MIIDECLKTVELRFRWRGLIEEAVADARAELTARRKGAAAGGRYRKKSDPTAAAAVKNITGIKSVHIRPVRGARMVYINAPEEWLEVIDAVYAEYEKRDPAAAAALRQLLERKGQGEAIAGLIGVGRPTLYDKRRQLLTDAAFLAAKKGLLK